MPAAALPLGRPPGPGRVRRALRGPGSRRDAVFPMRAARRRPMRGPGSARVAASPAQRHYTNNWRQHRPFRAAVSNSRHMKKNTRLTRATPSAGVGLGLLLPAMSRGLLWRHRRHLRRSPGVRMPNRVQKYPPRRVRTDEKVRGSKVRRPDTHLRRRVRLAVRRLAEPPVLPKVGLGDVVHAARDLLRG